MQDRLDTTVAGSWFGSPTKIHFLVPYFNGIKLDTSIAYIIISR